MVQHLTANKLITTEKHGFVQRRSCMNNMLELHALVVFLDFVRAFDKLSHQVLMFKLQHLGIDDKLLKWIADFLSGRK